MKQNKPPIKQHTVTNAILKQFADLDGKFWVYDRKLNEYRRQPTDDTTVVRDFHTFTDRDGNKCYELEVAMGVHLEGKLPQIIEKIDSFIPINEEDKAYLACFAAIQKFRTTAYRKDHNEVMKNFHLSMAKMAFLNIEHAENSLRCIKNNKIDPKDMVGFVDKLTIDNISIPQEDHLQMMIKLSRDISDVLLCLDWAFLRAPQNTSFIISDNPFSLFAPLGSHHPFEGVGMLTPKTEKALPLSPKTCLMMLDIGDIVMDFKLDRKMVRRINCRTAVQCDRFVMAKDEALLKNIVKITKINIQPRSPQFTISTPFNSG